MEIFKRRLLSVTLYLLSLSLCLAFLPFILPISFLIEVFIGKKFPVSRGIIFIFLYFLIEAFGIFVSFYLWLKFLFTHDYGLFIQDNFGLQCKWLKFIAFSSFKLFGIRVVIDGQDLLGSGPVLIFMRHTSVADTMIPAVFVSIPNKIILRYVLKKELLWDPSLDIVGNRLKNHFVSRNSENHTAEIEKVGLLAKDLKIGEGVIIYPEGTRFSEKKFKRALEKIRETGEANIIEKALKLKNVLPPRLGGSLELLKNNTGADIIFCSHVGLEGSASFTDFLNGKLINSTLRIKFWKVPFSEIPQDKKEQIDWFYNYWQKVDDFVEETKRITL